MKSTIIPQVRAISGSTPQEAALLFNEAMQELAYLHPKYEKDGNTFWIYYSMEIREPETVAERHELKGEGAHCKDCPHLVRDRNRFGDIDARKVYGTCAKTGERMRLREAACDIYYEESERGSNAEEHANQNGDD